MGSTPTLGTFTAFPAVPLSPARFLASGGSKSWIQRITINGKRRDIGLWPWPIVSLAKARARAFENRVAVADGRDPLAEKRKASADSELLCNYIAHVERRSCLQAGNLDVTV